MPGTNTVEADTAGRAGRPRDATIEVRVLDEALVQFGQRGWKGFSIEQVARNTGVGKASIYLRWKNKEDLLVDAVRLALPVVSAVDTGNVREDLRTLLLQYADQYRSESRVALDRLLTDADVADSLRDKHRTLQFDVIRAWRKVVRRGVERGELPATTDVGLVIHILFGAVRNHATVDRLLEDPAGARSMNTPVTEFVDQLIDFTLKAPAAE